MARNTNFDHFLALMGWIDGLPRWQRPILYGALLVVAWFGVRGGLWLYPLLVLVTVLRGDMSLFLMVLFLPLLAVIAGAAGGAVFALLLPLRRFGSPGRWLAWICSVAVYLVPVTIFIGRYHRPPFSFGDRGTQFAWLLTAVWGGSLGYWFFGRDDDPSSREVVGSTTRGILSQAVAADLAELEATPARAGELELIRTDTPSTALIMHWWRVIGRLGRKPGWYWSLSHSWALDRAEVRLRRAQARWNRELERRT